MFLYLVRSDSAWVADRYIAIHAVGSFRRGVGLILSDKALPRIAAILMLVVFAINVYIGLKDGNLYDYNLAHYYLNWLIAAVDIVAAVILFAKPLSKLWIGLAGVAWPIVYFASLAVDISTKLCLGGSNCWPTQYDAFRYLILGDPSEGWGLWPYTMSTAVFLLVVMLIFSSAAVVGLRREERRQRLPSAQQFEKNTKP